MEKLIIDGVRSFRDRVEADLAPVTLLLGENSTGKSTFLAMTRIAQRLFQPVGAIPDFNEEPFRLGSYDTIAHYHGGQGKRAKSFVIGGEFAAGPRRSLRHENRFVSRDGEPEIEISKISSGTDEAGIALSLARTGKDKPLEVVVSAKGKTRKGSMPNVFTGLELPSMVLWALHGLPADGKSEILKAKELIPLRRLLQASRLFDQRRTRLNALAPIRSQPERTYEQTSDRRDAAGAHVPMLVSRMFKGEHWLPFAQRLEEFGKESGLFKTISVKQYGKKGGPDPFQLELTLAGQKGARNLIDVGYGISQVLPVLVEILTADVRSQFLLQQPEVHLHPRAQAALGSLFAQLAAQGSRFVIETHSDHLVDRVLYAVRIGVLKPTDVSLLFFESEGAAAKVQRIPIDGNGNLDAPPSYRRFFLEEDRRLLGI